MSVYPCIKYIYKTFLQVSSVRYSGLALSEVSPSPCLMTLLVDG
nr:hypothetical protein [Candidatus Arsenophonus triatominarum]